MDKTGAYNFRYASFVVDGSPILNPAARGHIFPQYNLQYIPSCYYDGGETVRVGGYYGDTAVFAWPIRTSGEREVPDLALDISMTWLGNYEVEVTVTVTNNNFINYAPDQPSAPSGPQSGLLEDEHDFSVEVTDPDGDDLYCMWDWGDEQSEWMGPYPSGQSVSLPHKWDTPGIKTVAMKIKDVWDMETQWSDATPMNVVERGDANSDYEIHVADAVFMINNVFKGGANPDPLLAGDANCSSDLNVADAVFLINFVFNSGPPPICP